MRITAKTDYAVRACVELAAVRLEADRAAGRPTSGGGDCAWLKADALAERQGVPEAFTLSILSELRRAGLVESRRGADGGYRLAQPPASTSVADVVRAIDGPLANVAGSYVEETSYGGAASSVRDVWVALRASLRTVLEATTLADVASHKLPEHVRALLADEEAWSTRPHGRTSRVGGR